MKINLLKNIPLISQGILTIILIFWDSLGYAETHDTSAPDHILSFPEPIATDRPSFSMGVGTIRKGHVQFETGYTFTLNNKHTNTISHTFPETLIRIGVNKRFEVRLEWPNQSFIKDKEGKVSGLRDLNIGFKTKVFQQQGWRPQLSIAGRLFIPTGKKRLSSNRVNPELLAILSYALDNKFSLFGNINISGANTQNRRFAQFSTSLGLNINLWRSLSGFIEYFSFHPIETNSHSTHFMQAGIVYQLTPQFQLDTRIGTGLNKDTDDMLIGVGISWRL